VAERDGDGWVECTCGHRHWGKNGAAGLLLIREGKVLLQHRAPWVHNGDTWGIPGGARDSHETIEEAAFREAREEIGLDTANLTTVHEHEVNHEIWSYHTVIAHVHEELGELTLNDECVTVEWVEYSDVEKKTLHPSFAQAWPALLTRLRELAI
jgi:8-oxo-dGTP diphosphatase